jgi:hypothetical protein
VSGVTKQWLEESGDAFVQSRRWSPGDEYSVVTVQVSKFKPGSRVQVIIRQLVTIDPEPLEARQ